MPRVLVADPVAADGVKLLRQHAEVDVRTGLPPAELEAIIGEYDALVVRSETKVTAAVLEAGRRLQVVGRAGVGVDNIDVEKATQRGILVVNAPTGNNIAAAEHTIALMLAMARKIPPAYASLRNGEWQRSRFQGFEVRDKVLGVIGLGKIGSEVAKRAIGLEMKVLAHDPFVSEEYASNLGVQMASVEDLLRQADVVSIHTPLTQGTRGLIAARELAIMKNSAVLVNTSRGAVIDENALLEALDSGEIAGAALDVFVQEPPTNVALVQHPKVIATPHLAASTQEAQVNVSIDVAEQIVAVLQDKPARYAVNAPFIIPETAAVLAPYAVLAEKLAYLLSQIFEDTQLGPIEVTYGGELAEYDTLPLRAAIIKGLLEPVTEEHVNLVNAGVIARQRGLNVVELTTRAAENYASLLTLAVDHGPRKYVVAGTVSRDEPHVVRIDKYWIDVVPQGGYLLLSRHLDRPGMIGKVGTILGQADVNIYFMQVGRLQPRGEALMVLGLDEPLSPEIRSRLLAEPDIYTIKVVKL